MKEQTKTVAINILAASVAALALFFGVALQRQWSQYSLGEAAAAKGDVMGAITGYEAAIHMYVPLSPLVSGSARKLWQIGQEQEQKGDRARALIAYRTLRSSYYAARWLFQPGKDWIARCDERIARLAAPGAAGAR